MKFCKQLHRMMNISDPEWAPYYTNYKMLKKLIKGMQPPIPPTTTTAAESPTTPTTTTVTKPNTPQQQPELIDVVDTDSEEEEEEEPVATGVAAKVTSRMQVEDCSDDDDDDDDDAPSPTTPCRPSSTRTTTSTTISAVRSRHSHQRPLPFATKHPSSSSQPERTVVTVPPPPPTQMTPPGEENVVMVISSVLESPYPTTTSSSHQNDAILPPPPPPTTTTTTQNTSSHIKEAAFTTTFVKVDVTDVKHQETEAGTDVEETINPVDHTTVNVRKDSLVEEHKNDEEDEEEAKSGDDASVPEHKSSIVERSPLHKKQCCKSCVEPSSTTTCTTSTAAAAVVDVVVVTEHVPGTTTTDTTATTTTFTHPSTPGMILSLPQSQHFDIRTNVMEQYFFRCLHFEVRKVSYFYQTMMQDLYARYQQIHQSIGPVFLQQQSRIASTNANTNSASCVHATTTTVPSLPKTRRTKKIPESTSTGADTTTNRNRSMHYGIHHLLSRRDSDSMLCVDRGTNATAPSSSTTTTATTRIPVDDDEEEEEHRPTTTAASSSSDPNVTISIALLLNIYKLSRDLLLLETYCIMALTSFSKILKKHDKVTGYNTKHSFMTKIVIPSNFVQTQQEQQQKQHEQKVSGDGPATGRIRRPLLLPPMPTKQSLSLATSSSMGAIPTARSVRPNARARRMAASGSGMMMTPKIPSLNTMIDQCYTWYNALSEQYETRQSLYGEQEQLQRLQRLQLQQQQSLQYDEYLFLHMIQKFQQ